MTNHVRWMFAGALALLSGFPLSSCSTTGTNHTPKHSKAHQPFDMLDTNKDGKLSLTEAEKSPLMRKSSDHQATFAEMDSNGDGYISKTEMRDYRAKNKKS